MSRRIYSDAEKAAYYRRKASQNNRFKVPTNYVSGRGSYTIARMKANYKKPYRYPGAGSRYGKALGGYIGDQIPGVGGRLGSRIGKVAGRGAHALMKTVTGFGDYKVSRNSLVYNQDSVPEFNNNNQRCTFITHREFISDVVGSVNFNVTEYRINPAISNTFPWLSSIAQNYEQYVVQGMLFEYKTTSATSIASTSTALGTVVLATQYNSLSPAFTNKQEMENYEFCQSTVPCESVIHPIECDPAQTQCGGIFNMWSPVNSSGDLRLYDMGRFNIATVGMQSGGSTIGELWVTYKICLLKPRLTAISDVADGYMLSNISAAHPLGNSQTPYLCNDGFTTVGLGTNFNTIQIDPSFVGFLKVSAVYPLAAGTGGYFVAPTWASAGNIDNYTFQYTGLSAPGFITSVDPADTINGSNGAISIAYFKVNGGFDAGGNAPVISAISATYNAPLSFYAPARLEIISLPSSFSGDDIA